MDQGRPDPPKLGRAMDPPARNAAQPHRQRDQCGHDARPRTAANVALRWSPHGTGAPATTAGRRSTRIRVKREDFDHVVRAAGDVVQDDVVVIGSQAILGPHPDAPASLLTSLEVDLYPVSDPDRADLIDGALGDGSPFHETYGYYAHGVGPETAKAPAGWEERLVPVEVPAVLQTRRSVTAWCLEPHDLVLSKLAAGRSHDIEYATEAWRAGLVDAEELLLRADLVPASHRTRVGKRLDGILRQLPLS
jgi:uncharacterized nucleotidyltransferase DUF6036